MEVSFRVVAVAVELAGARNVAGRARFVQDPGEWECVVS